MTPQRLHARPLDKTFDLSGVKIQSELRGDTERQAETICPPEIPVVTKSEKGLAGSTSSGDLDSGVGRRILGTLLTWQAEHKKDVFLFATANQVQYLPPELLRAGRFDAIFFLRLPGAEERKEIFDIHLRKRNRDPKKFNLDSLARASEHFTGSECEEAIISGMYAAFEKGEEVSTKHIVKACKDTVRLAETMKEDIEAIEKWGKKRARPASSYQPHKGEELSRQLAGEMEDLEGEKE